jgi:transketolase
MTKSTKSLTKAQLQAEVAALRAQVAALAPAPVAPKAKVAPKFASRKEAVAAWKAEKGLTPELQDAYNAIYAKSFAKDWAKWTNTAEYRNASGATRKAMNHAKARILRNAYRTQAGYPEHFLEA